jgi:hypothetical protein
MGGRAISVPLLWYPRLADATPHQRNAYELQVSGYGIYWPDIDEDLRAYLQISLCLAANRDFLCSDAHVR